MPDSSTAPSPRQVRTDRFLRAVDIGTIAVLVFPFLFIAAEATFLDDANDDAFLLPLAVALALLVYFVCETYAIFMAFRLRNNDELTQAMWSSGTNFAFFAAIFWLFIAVWIEAIWTAIFLAPVEAGASAAADDSMSFVNEWASIVVLGAFFAGIQFKRLRG